MKHYWNDDDWEKLITERKTCPRATLPTHHQSHMDWPGIAVTDGD